MKFGVAIVLVTLYCMVTKHLDQVNLQKKAFNLVYGFQGLEFIMTKDQRELTS